MRTAWSPRCHAHGTADSRGVTLPSSFVDLARRMVWGD